AVRPAIVAMGRGGPADPVMAGPEDVTLPALLERARRGEHAASDYLEDALTAGVPTVGARRVGGGFAGMPFATNVAQAAARGVADRLAERLERTSGCRIVKVSDRLADRAGLDEDLRSAPPFDVLLTELKAAAVDVAAERAVARGADVVFVDNRPVTAQEAPADGELDDLLAAMLDLAAHRAAERT